MWQDIGDEVYSTGREETVDRHVMEVTVRGLRRNALLRAVNGFVRATGTTQRYLHDPYYHTALDTIAGAMVAAIFEETLLTPEEAKERVVSIERLAKTISPEIRFSGENW
jgi:hypothetical protein